MRGAQGLLWLPLLRGRHRLHRLHGQSRSAYLFCILSVNRISGSEGNERRVNRGNGLSAGRDKLVVDEQARGLGVLAPVWSSDLDGKARHDAKYSRCYNVKKLLSVAGSYVRNQLLWLYQPRRECPSECGDCITNLTWESVSHLQAVCISLLVWGLFAFHCITLCRPGASPITPYMHALPYFFNTNIRGLLHMIRCQTTLNLFQFTLSRPASPAILTWIQPISRGFSSSVSPHKPPMTLEATSVSVWIES